MSLRIVAESCIMKKYVWFLFPSLVLIVQCSHYDELQRNGNESTAGSTESHHFGEDCMTCHHDNGSEAVREGGWWNIAGSVYLPDQSGPMSDAKIELWSQPDREGQLYYTLEVDALGNFYTEKIVDFDGTCFPVVVDLTTGNYEDMHQAFHSGGCSSCHGKTEDVITVE